MICSTKMKLQQNHRLHFLKSLGIDFKDVYYQKQFIYKSEKKYTINKSTSLSWDGRAKRDNSFLVLCCISRSCSKYFWYIYITFWRKYNIQTKSSKSVWVFSSLELSAFQVVRLSVKFSSSSPLEGSKFQPNLVRSNRFKCIQMNPRGDDYEIAKIHRQN